MSEEFITLCDRCKEQIRGERSKRFTSGFYLVGPEYYWHKYSLPGEEFLCDECMWSDPRYILDYGRVDNTT
jgi:hypothetical protein